LSRGRNGPGLTDFLALGSYYDYDCQREE
jgi:hypothetical protein